jgi:hypothetical protein
MFIQDLFEKYYRFYFPSSKEGFYFPKKSVKHPIFTLSNHPFLPYDIYIHTHIHIYNYFKKKKINSK